MEHDQEVMVVLPEFVMKNRVKRAPSGGGLTITSYPVSNTTSLSWKPGLVAGKLS